MYQEIYIFLQSLNLDAVYTVDPVLRMIKYLIERAHFLEGSNFYLPHYLLFFLVTWAIFFRQEQSEIKAKSRVKDRALNSLFLTIFLSVAFIVVDETGLIFLDFLPLAVMILCAELFLVTLRPGTSLGADLLDRRSLLGKAGLPLGVGLAFFWALSISGPLAFFWAILCVPFSGTNLKIKCFSIFAVCVAFITTFLFSVRSQIFDYPRDAQLVPFSSVTSLGAAIIGPDRVPFPLYAPAFLEQKIHLLSDLTIYLLPVLLGFFYFLFLKYYGSYRGKLNPLALHSELISKYSAITLIMAFFILSTQLIPVYSNSPEYLLFRAIPGLVWRPYPFLLPGIFLLYLMLAINFYMPTYWKRAGIVSGMLLFWGSQGMDNFFEHRIVVRDDFPDPSRTPDLYHTPSLFLAQAYSNSSREFKGKQEEKSLVRMHQSENFKCSISASRNKEDSTLALDQNYNTRWSTKGPQQEGDWFKLACSNPVAIKRAALSIVNFRSDFPRGVRVNASLGGQDVYVLDYPEWFGPVCYSNKGLPYFCPQGEVFFDFPENIIADTLEFTLRKGDRTFDWSIGEVLLWQ